MNGSGRLSDIGPCLVGSLVRRKTQEVVAGVAVPVGTQVRLSDTGTDDLDDGGTLFAGYLKGVAIVDELDHRGPRGALAHAVATIHPTHTGDVLVLTGPVELHRRDENHLHRPWA